MSEREPRWLSEQGVIAMHDELLARHGGLSGIRDQAMLNSALNRAANKWHYGERNLAVLAAAYAYGIARNHAFVDGNKRTAYLAAALFLAKNGIAWAPPNVEIVVQTEALAQDVVSEAEYAAWIEATLGR